MGWLVEPEKWEALGRKLIELGEFCLDTETYDQPDRTSPQHRARVHCWSIGVLTSQRSPRGYNIATGRVLPVAALDAPAIREALGRVDVKKWAHNAPHDYHSIENSGVTVNGLEDTLQWLRVAVPGMRGYGLKEVRQWALGKSVRPSFKEVTGYTATVERSTFKTEKRCVCGRVPCRARSDSDWYDHKVSGFWRKHEREVHRVETKHQREVTLHHAVTSFVPGADLQPLEWGGRVVNRMDAWDEYSLADAIDGMELVSWLRNRPTKITPFPWGKK